MLCWTPWNVELSALCELHDKRQQFAWWSYLRLADPFQSIRPTDTLCHKTILRLIYNSSTWIITSHTPAVRRSSTTFFHTACVCIYCVVVGSRAAWFIVVVVILRVYAEISALCVARAVCLADTPCFANRPQRQPRRHRRAWRLTPKLHLLRFGVDLNIFIRQNRQQDRQRTDYIHTEKKYTQQ